MQEFYVKVGDSVTFAKTVGETDIYLFAGITGDFSVNHVNEQYMAHSKFGRRIAHGALIVGYMSTCSTMMIDKCRGATRETTPVSLGYDRVRFLVRCSSATPSRSPTPSPRSMRKSDNRSPTSR